MISNASKLFFLSKFAGKSVNFQSSSTLSWSNVTFLSFNGNVSKVVLKKSSYIIRVPIAVS